MYHQKSNRTFYNRYPTIFAETSKYFEERKLTPIVLSFGCSTGEEVFTLKDIYFKQSHIDGIDINKQNISAANSKKKHNVMFYSEFSEIADKKYDIIFCMSVFCRHPETLGLTNISSVYPFELFEKTINDLDKLLNVGGLLVIHNSNFHFSDCKVHENYDVLKFFTDSVAINKYDKNNNKIDTQKQISTIFIKKM